MDRRMPIENLEAAVMALRSLVYPGDGEPATVAEEIEESRLAAGIANLLLDEGLDAAPQADVALRAVAEAYCLCRPGEQAHLFIPLHQLLLVGHDSSAMEDVQRLATEQACSPQTIVDTAEAFMSKWLGQSWLWPHKQSFLLAVRRGRSN